MRTRRAHQPLAIVVALLTLLSACGSDSEKGSDAKRPSPSTVDSVSTSGNTASAPGVTEDSVTVAMVTTATGAAASSGVNAAAGIEARFAAENTKGGVHGRQLKLLAGDNATNPTQELTVWKQLVAKDPFAAIGFNALLFLSAPYLQEQGLPVLGAAIDGPEWAKEPYSNMFSWQLSQVSPLFPAYTGFGENLKGHGVTKLGALSLDYPGAKAATKASIISAEHAGIDIAYENLAVPIGNNDFTASVLAMKKAGVDGVIGTMATESALALATAIQQAGLELKYQFLGTGYSQATIDQPSVREQAQGSWFVSSMKPFELETPETKAMLKNLEKYAKNAYKGGVPDYSIVGGYLSADLFIAGLKVAGQNPTRESYIAALRKVTDYTAGGLLPSPVDFSHFGENPEKTCTYQVQLKGSKFVPSELQCGELIPGTEQL